MNKMRSLCLLTMIIFYFQLSAKSEPWKDDKCTEILVFLKVQNLPLIEIPALICDNGTYLPVGELFDFLQIKSISQAKNSYISGFILSPDSSFIIDRNGHQIIYKGDKYDLPATDTYVTPTELYLHAEYFGKIFDLNADFNFRNLTVAISPGFELPALREKRLEQMRSDLHNPQHKFAPDTVMQREKELFHLNSLDWGMNITRQNNGMNFNRFQLSLGGMLAGGELSADLNYNSNQPFIERNQQYMWRYVNNQNAAVRQIKIGKIPIHSISSIYHPIVGVQVTNAPSYYRQSFGFYYLSEHTQPGWTVELYVNKVLVDFVKADASGFFAFNVPLSYGTTEVMLRYYGPWGEENTTTRLFKVPFTFLPEGELEYESSAGFVEDQLGTFIYRGRVNYGLFRSVTLGAGAEYLSSLAQKRLMPFLTSSIKLAPGLLFSNQYVHGIRSKSHLSYYAPYNLRVELNYNRYVKEQEAVRYNYDEEKQAIISMPYNIGRTRLFSRLTLSHNKLQDFDFGTAEFVFSASINGFSANINSHALKQRGKDVSAYSILSIGLPPVKGWVLTPRIQYDHDQNNVQSMRIELKKRIFQDGFLQASYEKRIFPSSHFFQVGLLYDFSMGRASASISHSKYFSSANVTAGGSLLYEPEVDYASFSKYTNVGLASIMFRAFLDANANGVRDSGERFVHGLGVNINGGRETILDSGATLVIVGLEPYKSYFIELNGINFPSLAWKIDKSRIQIYLSANIMKIMDIPVVAVGEVSGMIYLNKNDIREGLGRMKINFYNKDSMLVAGQLSERDGYFNYLGLPPGDYFAQIDTAQLNELEMESIPQSTAFSIRSIEDGDIIDTFEFVLNYIAPTPIEEGENNLPEIYLDSTNFLAETSVFSNSKSPTIENAGAPSIFSSAQKPNESQYTPVYKVQLLASSNRVALNSTIFHGIEGVEEYKHEGMFKYSTGNVNSINEAMHLKNEMHNRGFSRAFIVPFINGTRVSMEEAINAGMVNSLPQFEDITFKVQVHATSQKLPAGHHIFSYQEPVDEYVHRNMYKYTFGNTPSLAQAIQMQYQLRQKGFEGAFVVAFKNGKRISLEQAINGQRN